MILKPVVFDDSIRQGVISFVNQKSNFFLVDKELRRNYQLVCVMNDRVADAIEYLNQHNKCAPKTVDEYYSFMVFADNLYEGVRLAYERIVYDSKLNVGKHKTWDCLCDDLQPYFRDKSISDSFSKLTKGGWLPDNTFFRYLRALSYAHPFETTEFKFINKERKKKDRKRPETHYCPFVRVGDNIISLPFGWNKDDTIEVVVYTYRRRKFLIFHVSYFAILQFLKSRYELLGIVTNHLEDVTETLMAKWSKRKIDRHYEPVDILRHLVKHLHGRGLIANDVEEIISFLTTEVNPRYPRNVRNVEIFRLAIKDSISRLCDLFEAQDTEGFFQTIRGLNNPSLPCYNRDSRTKKYDMVINHRDQIITCLNKRTFDVGDLRFGVTMLRKSFVRKWVTLNDRTMSVQEIWLLVCTAWYLEHKECVERGMLPQ